MGAHYKIEGLTSTGATFSIRVSTDHLQVFLTCTWDEPGQDELLYAVNEELRELKFEGRLSRELQEALASWVAEHGPEIVDYELFKGKPCTPPKDGRIMWARDFFNPAWVVDEETGRIDYRSRVAQVSVKEGEYLARIDPPVPGQPGRDVYGNVLLPSRPFSPRMLAGKNVRFDPEKQSYYATADGRLRKDGNALEVDPVYVIEGNAGLATGHIDHPGAVLVKGDIESGSRVRTKGDIEVLGVVEGADVVTSGSMVVHKGIIGREGTRIETAGDIHARYVNEAHIRVRGALYVERAIINSRIECRNAVVMPTGRVFGGEIIAHQGITVGQSGSAGMLRTRLTAGEDPYLAEELEPLETELTALQHQSQQLQDAIQPLLPQRDRLMGPKREQLTRHLQQLKELQGKVEAKRQAINTLKAQSSDRTIARIRVNKIVYPESVFRLGSHMHYIKEPVSGPVEVRVVEQEVQMVAVSTQTRNNQTPSPA